ncbi:retinol-DH_like_SDR_c domain-containing protein [Hypomesus transpacificus]|uniref:retinol-DH_like_SDR_c domain-containing protein n=1 Tax=Hypomesus transpacificus TaxID=137520 RepID=UPI001F0887DE|nr:retinol-DH_like_SDR_c domain-containing protein [Hypomesus transpacificus]
MWQELKTNPLVKYGAVTTVTTISMVLLRRWIAGGVCRSRVKLHGRTVVITGANTGIGKETARDMANRGARVILACRDMTRAEMAAVEIRQSTGNTNVVVRHLDLSSLLSVRRFAREFIASETRLDILINNAGVMMCPKSLTEDGCETQLAVNHLGHFLLTNLLLNMLRSSAPSRVVNVSSIAHQGGKIHLDDINFEKTPYDSLVSYRQSKLANLLFSRELARRNQGRGVTSFALHPGVIRTELGRYVQTRFPLLSALLSAPALLLMKTPWQGAQTSIYCAVTQGLENKTGCYFSDCRVKEPAPEGRDDLTALRLWDVSAKMVGFLEDV